MATRIEATIDTKPVKRALSFLGTHTPELAKDAFTRLGFEIRDAEAKHVGQIFSGPQTPFLAKGFRFDVKQRGSVTRLDFYPLRRSASILAEHIPGSAAYTARTGSHITVSAGPQSLFGRQRKLAIPASSGQGKHGRTLPVFKTRGRGRKIPKAKTPRALLRPGGKGFVSKGGGALLVRTGRGGRTVKLAYILVDQAENPEVFRFTEVAKTTAERQIGRATGKAFAKQLRRAQAQ